MIDEPTIADLFQQALFDHQAGRLQQAEAIYQQILAVEPTHADAQHLLGVIANQTDRNELAVDYIRRALRVREDPVYFSNLGIVLRDLGRLTEAEASCREALRLQPDYTEAHVNLGNALLDLGRPVEAEASYREALRLRPNYPEAHNNLGNALLDLGRAAEARASYREALYLRPDYPEAHNNLGNALLDLGRPAEAEASYREALRLRPNYPEAYNNLGNALRDLGRPVEAEASYREALRLRPNYPDAHNNLGHALLLVGRFEEGWKECEWRWKTKDMSGGVRNFSAPLWNGELIGDRVILLHAEQDLGDTLQLCRYVPLIASSAGVILEVQPPLVRLLSRLPGITKIVARGDSLPSFDLHCPLLSLPRAFDTTLDTIPNMTPYLSADPELAARWRKRLASVDGLRVGLVWAGGQRPDPPLAAVDRRRSITLDMMASFDEIPGVSFFSLQKDAPSAGSAHPPPGRALHDFTADLYDFADTAALVANLDLVISIDTAVAHLAGALGKPVWLLNRFDTDWRWLLARDDSPWYPTLRQFRQSAPGDWNNVIGRVAAALGDLRERISRAPVGLISKEFRPTFAQGTPAPTSQRSDLLGEAPAAGEPAPVGLSAPVVERLAPEPAAEGLTEAVPDSVAAPDDEPSEEALAPEITGDVVAGAADAKIVEAPLALDNTPDPELEHLRALGRALIAGSVGEPAKPAMAPKAGGEALTEEPEAEILDEPSASDGALPDPELEHLLTPRGRSGGEVGEPPEEALAPERPGEPIPTERYPARASTTHPALPALAAQVELHRAASPRLSSIARLGLATGAIVAAAGIGVWLMQPAAQKTAAGGPPASGATVVAGAKTSPTTQAPTPPATTSAAAGATATAPKSSSTSEAKPVPDDRSQTVAGGRSQTGAGRSQPSADGRRETAFGERCRAAPANLVGAPGSGGVRSAAGNECRRRGARTERGCASRADRARSTAANCCRGRRADPVTRTRRARAGRCPPARLADPGIAFGGDRAHPENAAGSAAPGRSRDRGAAGARRQPARGRRHRVGAALLRARQRCRKRARRVATGGDVRSEFPRPGPSVPVRRRHAGPRVVPPRPRSRRERRRALDQRARYKTRTAMTVTTMMRADRRGGRHRRAPYWGEAGRGRRSIG